MSESICFLYSRFRESERRLCTRTEWLASSRHSAPRILPLHPHAPLCCAAKPLITSSPLHYYAMTIGGALCRCRSMVGRADEGSAAGRDLRSSTHFSLLGVSTGHEGDLKNHAAAKPLRWHQAGVATSVDSRGDRLRLGCLRRGGEKQKAPTFIDLAHREQSSNVEAHSLTAPERLCYSSLTALA